MNLFNKNYFSYLPISLFGSVMGLCAMSITWRLMNSFFASFEGYEGFENISNIFSLIFALLAILAFISLIVTYGLKIIISFQSFKQEFSQPLMHPFFGTFGIALFTPPPFFCFS